MFNTMYELLLILCIMYMDYDLLVVSHVGAKKHSYAFGVINVYLHYHVRIDLFGLGIIFTKFFFF